MKWFSPRLFLHPVFVRLSLTVAASLMLASVASAATVLQCSAAGTQCAVQLEEGIIGDHVRVLDDKSARVVATGRIIKRRGSHAVISIKNPSKIVRRGYPVLVDVDSRDSSVQWAASFSNKD